MESLKLYFDNGRVRGEGTDVIGDFTFEGAIEGDRVYFLKQYVGQHQVEYYGSSDGEGSYFGGWGWAGLICGNWMIRVESVDDLGNAEIFEL